MTRDPRIDPRPGDELRAGAIRRRVVKREGGELLIQSEHTRYWVRMDRWQRWCEKGGADVLTGDESGGMSDRDRFNSAESK
jgi:hypothetical protein